MIGRTMRLMNEPDSRYDRRNVFRRRVLPQS